MRKRGRETWSKWRGLVAEQERSGESVAAFCRQRGLSASYFFAWKKKLSQAAGEQFVPVGVVGATEPALLGAGGGRAIEIRLCGECSVLVEPGFDAAHLRAVLAVLEARA